MSLVTRIWEFFFGIPVTDMVPGTLMDIEQDVPNMPRENITETCHGLRVPPPSKI